MLERRDHLGGACTLEQPFPEPGYLVSPCAYVVGMLDELVVGELDLRRHGYEVLLTDPNAWCPFPDGTSFARFPDDERTVAHMRENGFSEQDIRGAFAYEETFGRARSLLREGPLGDTWKRVPDPGGDRGAAGRRGADLDRVRGRSRTRSTATSTTSGSRTRSSARA